MTAQTATTDQPARPPRTAARLATELLAPSIWVVVLPIALAWHATQHVFGATVGWGLLVGITGSVVPMIVVARGARQGRWDGHHVTNREGRLVPFAVCIGSLSVGLIVLLAGNPPHEMLALAVAMFIALLVSVTITFAARWKVSMHAAVATGGTVVLTYTYGPWLALLTIAVAVVCWSRVALGDHTLSEVLGGTAIGLSAGGALYIVLEQALRA